ncbi:hypothetical protein L1887_62744 [Cichorium endivia]|nr:hypothetical protein L1887_62744 [Cichorium endivia]
MGNADLSLQDLLGDDLAVLVELVQDGNARGELEADCRVQANVRQRGDDGEKVERYARRRNKKGWPQRSCARIPLERAPHPERQPGDLVLALSRVFFTVIDRCASGEGCHFRVRRLPQKAATQRVRVYSAGCCRSTVLGRNDVEAWLCLHRAPCAAPL